MSFGKTTLPHLIKQPDLAQDALLSLIIHRPLLSPTAGLQEMARYPNVYCKASGMFATDPKWDQKSVDTVVKPLFH